MTLETLVKLLRGAHADGRPALDVRIVVSSPAGRLTKTEEIEVEALAAAFRAGGGDLAIETGTPHA